MSIPANYVFADACNDGKVIDFFYKNLNADIKDYNGKFIHAIKELNKKILDNIKIVN